MFEKEGANPIFLDREKLKELALKLRTIPETSGALRRTLSTENVQKFMQIMTSPEITDLDILYLSGGMSAKEVEQYLWASGDYSRCAHNLTELALKMAGELKGKLLTLAGNELRKQKNEGIYNLFNSINDLFGIRSKQLDNVRVFGTDLGELFIFQLMALVGSDLIDLENSLDSKDPRKILIKKAIQDLDQYFVWNENVPFVGRQLYSEKIMYARTLTDPKNSELLDRVIGFSGKYDEAMRINIEEENRKKFSFIKQEVAYKEIPVVTLNEKDPQIILRRDNSNPDVIEVTGMPDIRINFRSGEMIDFPRRKIKGNKSSYEYSLREGIINLKMDPETGDLCFMTGGIPIRQIVSRDRHLALQKYIVDKLKIFLEGKDPDIKDLFMYLSADTTREQTSVSVLGKDEKEDDLSVARGKEDQEYISRIQEDSSLDVRGREEVSVLPKHLRTTIMNRINGARAEDILRAIRRMLGDEVRTEGSHYLFQSKRNGIILPVPRHSRESKHHISLSLIINNLRLWGYRPLELAIELGVNIPKRYYSRE